MPLTLNAEAKVAEGNDNEQGANRLETGWDPKEIRELAKRLDQIAAGWDERRKRPVQILRVLCKLTERDPDRLQPGVDSERWGFRAKEILGEMTRFKVPGAEGWATDQERAKGRMHEHWPEIEAIWERQLETIEDGLSAAGIDVRPKPWSSGSAGGHANRYGFRFDAKEGTQGRKPPRTSRPLPVDLDYRLQTISDHWLIHWISGRGLYLGGWAGKLYLFIFGPLLFGGLLLLWLFFVAMVHAPTSLDFLKIGASWMTIIAVCYLIFGWQFRLVANRIALAPLLLQPFGARYNDYLLELRPDPETERNTLHLVRYVANCPICAEKGCDTVRIESGRLEFFGRLVGRCNRSPNEHVFSFDHVTRHGRFLR